MKYQIKTDQPQQQFLQIRAEINVSASTTILQFPAWRPGRYELGNFAKNVRAFQVLDENDKPIEFEKISKDQWRLASNGLDKVIVQYDYYATELNAGSTFLDASRLYVNPVNCLVYAPGGENDPCSLEIELFQEMKYSGTLPMTGNTIHAKSYHELVDSPFIFCDEVESRDYHYGGVDFKISFIGRKNVPWERVLNDFQKFTQKQFDDFGAFPVKTFHFIVIVTPYPHYHGVEHLASTIIVLGPTPDIFGALYDELLGVSSHELYHVWNVKSIRSVDLFPYDYSRENYSKMGYLCEGITTYLGDYYLMSSGVWSPERYFKELSDVVQKHLDNPGRFNFSLAESSFDTWLDGYVVGAPGRKTSIYNEGALFAFVTDVFIRKNTDRKASISDVMRALYHDFYWKGKGVSESDFVQLVSDMGTQDFKSVFNDLIHNRVSFENTINQALNYLGLEMVFHANPDPVASRLGIKTIMDGGLPKITSIVAGSLADMAGLMLGDKIWSVNGQVVRGDFAKWLAHFRSESLHIIADRSGTVFQTSIPESEIQYFKIVVIKTLDSPTDNMKRALSLWCGIKS
jgi:predicted metalloprotease with PDZ domain